MKPANQVIGLRTLTLRGRAVSTGPVLVDTAVRAFKRRVFTDEQWAYLNQQSTADLEHRIQQGNLLIGMLSRPEMMNMVKGEADRISSNLRYQQDAIRQIISSRGGLIDERK